MFPKLLTPRIKRRENENNTNFIFRKFIQIFSTIERRKKLIFIENTDKTLFALKILRKQTFKTLNINNNNIVKYIILKQILECFLLSKLYI